MAKALDRFDPNPKKNVSLKTKLIAMIVGASMVGVFVSGAVAFAVFNRGMHTESLEELENTTGGVQWILEDWLDTIGGYGDMLASTDHIKGYLDGTYNWDDDDFGGSIWTFEEMFPRLAQDIVDLGWLKSYLMTHPQAVAYFYDSY